MKYYFGIDVGNFDTKSYATTTPNGYTEHLHLPTMTAEWLFYNDKYYVPSVKRFDYKEDKTLDDRCLILTLMGIAKQALFSLEAKKEKLTHSNKENQNFDIQAELNSMTHIILGAGLPPKQWYNAKKTKEYYLEKMQKGIQFSYCGYQFNFYLEDCKLYPQNYAAVVTNAQNEIIKTYTRFLSVDIGGGTADFVPVYNGETDIAQCATEKMGIIYMYQAISQVVLAEHGISVENYDIESTLTGRKTMLSEAVQNTIHNETQKWANSIVDKISQLGFSLDSTPILFLGGGSILLEPYFNENPLLVYFRFIRNPNANAIGYERLIKKEFKRK